MYNNRWRDNLIQWITIVFVAGMLPLSCIVHCHVNDVPADSPGLGFFVCHPFTTVDTDSPQHLHAHTVTLRATHEVALPLGFMLIGIILLNTLIRKQQTYVGWQSAPSTPPPR